MQRCLGASLACKLWKCQHCARMVCGSSVEYAVSDILGQVLLVAFVAMNLLTCEESTFMIEMHLTARCPTHLSVRIHLCGLRDGPFT